MCELKWWWTPYTVNDIILPMDKFIPGCWQSHELHLHLPQDSLGEPHGQIDALFILSLVSSFLFGIPNIHFGFWPHEGEVPQAQEYSEPGLNAEVAWPLCRAVWPFWGHWRTRHVTWFSKSRRNLAGLPLNPCWLSSFMPFKGHLKKYAVA